MAINTHFTDLNQIDPTDKEWEACSFTNCSFTTLSHHTFTDCTFENCNLSNCHIANTAFRNCTFKDCKLVGVNFSSSREFGFEVLMLNCNLDYTAFDRKKCFTSTFRNCTMRGANFTEADCSKTIIENCDFTDAVFMSTNLSGINFTTNHHFLIDPNQNNLKKTKFSRFALGGLLYKSGIVIE